MLINPTIAVANTTNNIFTCDAVSNSVQPLLFYQDGITQSWASCANGDVYAMPATPLNIYSNQSYLVSYYTQDTGGGGNNMLHNEDQRFNIGCYELTNCAATSTTNECWSTNACVLTDRALNYSHDNIGRIYSLYQIASGFVSNGTYTSTIFDSGQNAGTAKTITWSNSVPSNTWMNLYARTGNQPDMSDAPAWNTLTNLTSTGSFPNNTGRYIQFRASMGTSPLIYPYPPSPRLISVTFNWPGDIKMIDVAGIMTRGPDYAQVKVTVDGQPLTRSINVDLTIYKYVRRINGGSNEQFTSFITEEIQPRNTGM